MEFSTELGVEVVTSVTYFHRGSEVVWVGVETETKICGRYEAKLALIAALDRAYCLNPEPTAAERANYYKRQEIRERIRAQFYAELRRFGAGISPCGSAELKRNSIQD